MNMDIEAVLKILRQRRSIRRFRKEPVEDETILKLIEAAAWAPSAGNRQDWGFIVVSSSDVKKKMGEAVSAGWRSLAEKYDDSGAAEELKAYLKNFSWFAEAPAVIVITSKKPELFLEHILSGKAGSVAGTYASACMAAQNLMLAAQSCGIGSCCLTGPVAVENELKEMLAIKKRRDIVCLMAIGYPENIPQAPSRRSAPEIARFIK